MSTSKDFRVAVVGGGIGGLFCAISLYKAGIPFDLFEATEKFGEVGAGIGFSPNAIAAMKYLGFLEAYERVANRRTQWSMIMGDESHEHVVDFARPKDNGAISSIHRAHMLDILLSQVPEELCHLGKRCISVEEISAVPPVYKLHFQDGTTHETNLVIGADGIRSNVRDFVLGTRVEPRYSGTRAFRGLFSAELWKSIVGEERASSLLLYSGLTKHLVIFPIDGGLINLVAFISAPLENRFTDDAEPPPNEAWVQPADYKQALAEFSDMGPHVKSALQAIDRMTVWKIFTLWPPLPTYVNGGVALLGDAAHGMTPHCGQGAGQALEAACLLGRILGHRNTTLQTIPEALKIYDRLRRPRGNRVLEYALESGDIWDGWGPGGDSLEGRRKDSTGRMDWIWDYDVEEDWASASTQLESISQAV